MQFSYNNSKVTQALNNTISSACIAVERFNISTNLYCFDISLNFVVCSVAYIYKGYLEDEINWVPCW